MNTILIINLVIAVVFSACYAYQLFFLAVPFAKKQEPHKPEVLHRFAVLICARNEEEVIPDLIHSIQGQTYDQSLITIFVMADNCTDATAEVARQAGAVVYTRFNKEKVGKGYALERLIEHIEEDYPQTFDGFFVFDADNVLDCHFIEEMNRTYCDGYEVITSYRNSKNYGDNWISAGYALWFIRESRYLNNSRMLLGTSCAVSGTGFLFSRAVLEETGPWPFHLLTEDIQFSTFCCAHNVQIGFAPAEFFDEQPLTFKASWTQRMRWTKGFYQVFFSYGRDLVKGIRKGQFASYDMLMTIAPGMILTLLSFFVNAVYLIVGTLSHGFIATEAELSMCVGSLVMTFASMYVVFFILAVITTISEREHIHAKKKWRIITNLFTFPIFMMTYIPITVAALFKKVEWVPTKHDIAVNFDDVMAEGAK